MYIRLSRNDDKEQIRILMRLCFGERKEDKVFDNLQGRYLLAFENGQLIGMTGLYYSDEYKAYEMDWTCTRPEYRHKGIMHELFRRICSFTDEDIYCSCWRLNGNEQVNLHSLMRDFGFKEVVRNRVSWQRPYNCKDDFYCVNCSGDECRCYEDLYIRCNKHRNLKE